MDPGLLATGILVGFGFGNTFLCSLLSLGMTAGQGWKVGAAFLTGRFLGVMALIMVAGLAGWYIDIDARIMLFVLSAVTIVISVLVLLYPSLALKLSILRKCETGPCSDCDEDEGVSDECTTCPSRKECTSRTDKDDGKRVRGKAGTKPRGFGPFSAALVGAVKGATPRVKFFILLPLFLTLPLRDTLLLGSAYALSSSIYPVLGILAGTIIGTMASERLRPYLVKAGALTLLGLGLFYFYRAVNYSCSP